MFGHGPGALISYGQIGVKQAALMAKVPSTPLPPQLAPAIREEERAERRQARQQAQPPGGQGQAISDRSDQRQAGPGSDEAASDPTSGTTSASSSMVSLSVDDDMVLEDLVKNLKEDNRYDGGVDISPKRGGDPVEEEVQSTSKALKQTALRKVPRLGDEVQPSSTASASGANRPQGDDVKVRMVVSGDLLEDGDGDLELPAQPPDLAPHELFQVEAESIKTGMQRLVEMGVLVSAEGADFMDAEKLST